MNENLKGKITRKLDELSDEVGRQLLDYLEFLESKYNRSRRSPSTMQRIAENIEDRLGSVRIGDIAAKGTAQVVDAAGRVMEGLATASRAVAEELQPRTGEEPVKQEQSTAESEAQAEAEAEPGAEASAESEQGEGREEETPSA
ncbi:MAG: hypothetical protein GTN78_19975 [Gemmatimonadales bacterium]|nr:hypothetical protein [Gemmatimonadales bacterium]NIN12653.1 hypothetical protein [Gemmatimonadales bacterium]NIR02446.1 hypothetical protein [Gemmatimonadales bacterium]NIS66237.1 hypothetical protein [Gemmatimonadales bacterium]